MGKINPSVARGQLDTALPDLPVIEEEAAPAAPSRPTSVLSGLVEAAERIPADVGGPETAAIVGEGISAGLEEQVAREEQIEAQRERELIPDLYARGEDTARVDTYERDINQIDSAKAEAEAVSSGTSPDGGLFNRAANFANQVEGRNLGLGSIGPHADNAVKQTLTTAQAITPEGQWDRDFLELTSIVTENAFADLAFGQQIEEDIVQDEEVAPGTDIEEARPVSKAQGNKHLGQMINREWQRYKNAREGRPTDQYQDLSPEQATLLGDVAKEMYYEANKTDEGKQFLLRGRTDDGKQVAFTLTKHGSDRMKAGADKRKRMFPKQHVRPTKAPTPGGRLVGEGRTVTRPVSSRTGGVVGADTLKQAMRNLNQIPNVVDSRRLKILLATALPLLSNEAGRESVFAKANNAGSDVYNGLVAAAKKRHKKDLNKALAEADTEYKKIVDNLAQSIFGIVNERDGANYLTYYLQAFNGRIAPQQSHFDPTTSKAVRFVTRNAVPAKATPGSRIDKNLRQMYAMTLIPGADVLLPAGREAALKRNTQKLVFFGKRLKELVNGISDAQLDATSEAIKQGIPVNDPNFPKLPALALDPETDADLIAAIESKKDEDIQNYIEGLIDFYDYNAALNRGQPYYSYFNAYMDGKTNGLASNGIQMGSEEVATRTGVIRTQNDQLLDKNEDIRDALKKVLLEELDNGFEGHTDNFGGVLHEIASNVFGIRDLNKSTTMTFPYGMELSSMKDVIEEYMDAKAEGDPVLRENINLAIPELGDLAIQEDPTITPENRSAAGKKKLVETLHQKYIVGLAQVLDPNALKSRSLMRSAAILHALTNELFTITTSTGFEQNLGGTETTGWTEGTEYRVWTGEKYEKRQAGQFGEEITSAAIKSYGGRLVPGGHAYGGSVPGPIQSLDAATVALTVTGSSWNRLRNASNGNPYIHTIYDAFKVDAMGYDAVMEESNKNWLNSSMNWSYLEETEKSLAKLRKTWAEKTKDIPDSAEVSGNEWLMAGYLLSPSVSQAGKLWPGNLKNMLEKLMEDSDKAFDASWRIINGMKKVNYNFYDPGPPTMGQLRKFIELFSKEVNLAPRLRRMINETNDNKKKLRGRIRQDAPKKADNLGYDLSHGLQYYAH